ncbi:fluoride efflux transporter CrcB [Mesorhizobium qingshengii]|uniref:Fluoride-specific ion channel FluC n=1 Tax=Mesorhizobium qingshengii TaxID=1165689 RepID=A0ABT4QXT8_9HYPH|nr:fluoride efflux transporter CrcB [Mesorhizobium qingshengii]MCZ8546402.1 fluoride efflux transporter CrcB [Mesorhizobium qingshengii]
MNQLEEVEADEQPPLRSESPAKVRRQAIPEIAQLYLAVSAGAVIGSVLRALASIGALAWLGPGFPWGTLFVNVLGSFVIGFYATLTGPDGRVLAGTRWRQFVMTGICGGFTTFSTFSLETFRLFQGGHWPMAGLNVGVSIVTWLVAVWLGHMVASRLNRLGGV